MDFLDGVVFCHTYLYTILILYVVMSLIQCMFDVWLCHAFCALCNLTLMLCIWECALAHKALLFSAPRLFCSLLFIYLMHVCCSSVRSVVCLNTSALKCIAESQ